jgi:hypothetical protein
MTKANDTIRVLIPLSIRKKNGRPKIQPPADYLPSEDQMQDPHILRAIGRAWGWRRRMEAGEFGTIQEMAEAVGLAERHVSRQLRLAYLAPEVLKRLTCGREASTVSLYDLCFLVGEAWGEQVTRVRGDEAPEPRLGGWTELDATKPPHDRQRE